VIDESFLTPLERGEYVNLGEEITLLVVTQDGKRKAEDVELEVDRVMLTEAIEIFDNAEVVNEDLTPINTNDLVVHHMDHKG
jgi:hypothetical protein